MTALPRPPVGSGDAPPSERRLLALVRVLLLFESAMYSAVTPILPHYAHTLHASKPQIGVLAAAYSAGLIPGSLLGGWLAVRAGVRRTTIAGLVAFGVAVAGLGFAGTIGVLDALRAVQGVFCGLIWGGGLTWVIAAAPAQRRGQTIGTAIGAATFGTLLGPLLGIGAVAVGTRPAFVAIGAIALGLAAWTRRQPDPGAQAQAPAPATRAPMSRRAALRSPGLALGTWLVTLEALTFGAASALLPLRLSRFGVPAWEIGATFVAASAISTALSPLVGASTDRRGARRTICAGLTAAAPLLAILVLPRSGTELALLSVVALGVPLTACMIPAVSLMTAATERAGVALVLATTLVNLAYAVGETVGAPVAAALSQLSGDALPLLLVAGLMLATLAPVLRGTDVASPAPGRPRDRGGMNAPAPRAGAGGALHRLRAARSADPQRRTRRGDRRRADRADRPPPVRLGPAAPPSGGDPTAAEHHPGGSPERP